MIGHKLVAVHRTAEADRHKVVGSKRYFRIGDNCFLLMTFEPGDAYDGCSNVFHRMIGETPVEASPNADSKILVTGIPPDWNPDLSTQSRKQACYSTFESDRIPSAWVDSLNSSYAHCIVPHEAIKSVYESSGVRIPISVIHQGYTRYQKLPRVQDTAFRIGFLGVPQARKNLPKLFEACRILHQTIPSLRLAIHVATYYDITRTDDLAKIKSSPFVEWTEGKQSPQEISHWYARLSAYVFPSSGEGWSFTPRESLYLGIPTIISDIPVHKELVASGFCTAIPTRGWVDDCYDVRTSSGGWGTETIGKWQDISVDDIHTAIQAVYSDYERHSGLATSGAEWISEQWRNEDCVSKVKTLLLEI